MSEYHTYDDIPLTDHSETPEEIYASVTYAYHHIPDYIDVYKRLADVYYRLIGQNTQFNTIQFNSPYAKTAYLLKEHGADRALSNRVHDLRMRLKTFGDTKQKDTLTDSLRDACLHDIVTLSRFIAQIYKAEMPPELAAIKCPSNLNKVLPADTARPGHIRFIVTSWDDDYIYGEADGYDQTYRVNHNCYADKEKKCFWSYIKGLIKPQSQLNLVHPTILGNTITPELIIYEPDYLVNITEISSCFTPACDDSLNSLINKMRPNETTEAILLGHFASQLLDDAINSAQNNNDYNASVRRFYKTYAYTLAANKVSSQFHANARAQCANIRRSLSELETAVSQYDKSQIVLEPSFLCQILGLQGRVDMLQQDMSLLIEQKSGKCAYPEPKDSTTSPKASLPHIVQMMLYVMIIRYNYPNQYADNNGINSFLLYSKYDKSLCSVGTVWPELRFKAIKIRNEIVSREFGYANDGFGILDTITPEMFNKKACAPALWEGYLYPQLSDILNPVHAATPTERAYFYRMMQFIANEHLLSKIGSNRNDDHGLASLWLSPLDIKRQSGNIYDGMTLISPDMSHDGTVTEIVLSYDMTEDNVMANFRKGDIVVLYPYDEGSVPDACNTIITRCTIADIKADTMTLSLRAPQADARMFNKPEGTLWAIEHDLFESSYNALYKGAHSFLKACRGRKDLLMLQRKPETDTTVTLTGSYGSFDKLALRVKQARDLFMIIGPPGTGKTSYGMLYTLEEQLTVPGTSVMIASYTNRAVDEICSKLVEQGIEFIRIGSPITADPSYEQYFIDRLAESCPKARELEDKIRSVRVIVGTTAAFSSKDEIFKLKQFDLAIIDEASQILEPHLLPILSAMHGTEPAVKKFVLIGDHKQLPAVVRQSPAISEVTDPMLNAIGLTDCRMSLFERLLKAYGDDKSITYMLTHQGRMHKDIADFSSQVFYEGKLKIVPLKHQYGTLAADTDCTNGIRRMLTAHRVSFVAVSVPTDDKYISDKVNMPEAEVIAATVAEIYRLSHDTFSTTNTVGVIVPYRNQIATVRSVISSYGIPELNDITVDTVERYQGSQRDNIIYGTTIQKGYQLGFLTGNTFIEHGNYIDRKLNVAMTRARERLIIVGDPKLLQRDYNYNRLIEHIRHNGAYIDAETTRYITGNF